MKKRWSYDDAVSQAKEYVDSISVPGFALNVDKPQEGLNFADVMKADNKQLVDYLVMYGGSKSLLEQHVADLEARRGAMEAQYIVRCQREQRPGCAGGREGHRALRVESLLRLPVGQL